MKQKKNKPKNRVKIEQTTVQEVGQQSLWITVWRWIGPIIKYIGSPVLLGTIYFYFSSYFLVPNVEIIITKNIFANDKEFGYGIIINNKSDSDLHNFMFSFRFGDSCNIKRYSYVNISSNSIITLRSREDFNIRNNTTNEKLDPNLLLVSGFRGFTDMYKSGADIEIEVVLDTSWDKRRLQPYPSGLDPSLYPYTYYYSYEYAPIGLLSSIRIKKDFIFTFDGVPTSDYNDRSYRQLVWTGKDTFQFGFTISEVE